MSSSSDKSDRKYAINRKALHDYLILEQLEAGVELKGTEVKSVRNGHISLAGSFARIKNGEVFLYNTEIPLYEYGGKYNHDPERIRRLLFHKKEIERLRVQIEQKGCVLVPLSVYMKNGIIKINLGLCKGKRMYDKRETLRRKAAERDAARAVARKFR